VITLRGRSDASLTITVMTLVVSVLTGVWAPEAVAVRRAAATSFDSGGPRVDVAGVMTVRVAADASPQSCSFALHVSGRYNKPDFTATMREEGTVTGTSTCGADLIPVLELTATIDDFGMPGAGLHQVANGYKRGSGPGPVLATVSQDVLLVQAPPPDSYRIEWTFHLHAVSVEGQQATGCAKLQAVFPGDVSGVPC
jgi:hypothetical protein